jgi:acyl carrier protein phosphodiesterase
MNYLAHSLLSFNHENLVIGNFIADHIRRAEFDKLEGEIQKGVMLHRKIDYYTDRHPLFLVGKRFFYGEFEKYSGVLLDIYYDHILAQNFGKYSEIQLPDFSRNIYFILDKNIIHLPGSSQQFLKYIKGHNTYFEYSKIKGIELVLKHLSHRINHGIDLSRSLDVFIKNKEKIENDFFVFMGEMIDFVKKESLLLQ